MVTYLVFGFNKDNIEGVSFGVVVFDIPRGTRDFSPEEMQKRRFLENKLRKVFESYGYQEVQTPTFEHLDLFTEKSGDQIIEEIYSFTDKGGRKLALRPELTAPVIRFYVDKLQMNPKPLKLFYFGNCFRYDRPQKGRYREFMQAGCELVGTDKPEAIAELISMAYSLVTQVGLQQVNLQIGDLSLLKQLFACFDVSSDVQSQLIPAIDKEEFEEVEHVLLTAGFSEDKVSDFVSILQSSDLSCIKSVLPDDARTNELVLRFQEVFSLLKTAFQIESIQLNLGIVRGLDYYSGIVFEIEAPQLGAEKQICGGGEYELISLFGGRETPTAGFALGFDRTLLAMQLEHQTIPKESLDYYIVPFDDDIISQAMSIAQKLRAKKCSVDIDLMRRGVGKALKYANSRNTRYALIIGPDEIEKKSVTMKEMESGDQRLVPIKDLLNKKKPIDI